MDVRMRRTVAVVLALVAMTLSACAPTPAPTPTPTPTPTGFASEEEAFAAAEATIRAYVAATNQVDAATPASFEPVFALTTGEQNAFDRTRLSQYHADGYVVSGHTEIIDVRPEDWFPADESVTAWACLDVTTVEVVDGSGVSIVSPDRPDLQAVTITTKTVSGAALISSIAGAEATSTCAR